MTRLYYTAPQDHCFEDLKKSAMQVWEEVASDPSYLEEKVDKIKNITNMGDNFMYIFAMFDTNNQRTCALFLKPETIEELRIRLIDGGMPYWQIEATLGII